MKSSRQIPPWAGAGFVMGALGILLLLERKRPLRKMTQSKLKRDTRNLAMAAFSAATIKALERPIVGPLTRLVEYRRWGLVKRLGLPPGLETLLVVILMDYTLYFWHYLTHKIPFLWRFHEAHHIDLDLDTTTALRFHFGEMVLSTPWRALQILIIGVSPRNFSIWQAATTVEILFHHSNVKLPERLERWLSRVIVTPRMHGIHHSTVKEETDSNWSTIFSLADRLHGTLKLNVPQDLITIGVPAYQDPEQVSLGMSLALPFQIQVWQWTRPGQSAPKRPSLPLPQTALVR